MTSFARSRQRSAIIVALAAAGMLAAFPIAARAQTDEARFTPKTRIGVQGIGVVGVNWLGASESLEAANLATQPVEVGGAAQITNLWRDLFVQVSASRMSSDGERVFVDDDGNTFPLGTPLSVKASYVDVSVGWKVAQESHKRYGLLSYVGAGAGRVHYTEESPFAQSGDDLDTSATSYHAIGGVEVRLRKWLSVSADLRYRWVPNLLGDGGVSAVLGEDDFGGFGAGIGLRFGFGGPDLRAPDPDADEPARAAPEPYKVPERVASSQSGIIISSAAVYLRPDATLEPLRVLEPGTAVRILQENDDWIRIEFADRLLGPRVGYVLRKNIQLPK
jgi:opacity protein-like surface antigen